MKRLGLLAICAAVVFAATSDGLRAQSAPGAPAITSLTAGRGSLTVVWSAPASDGGTAITTYDLRYIESDASDKADDLWTVREGVWSGGALQYLIGDLYDGESYDVQARAVNADGEGAWSATQTEWTTDHGDTSGTATNLSLGSSVAARLGTNDDVDHFRIRITERTDLWVYTTGGLDTYGSLLSSNGLSSIIEDDDGYLLDGPLNFSIRRELSPGTYFVKVSAFSRPGVTNPHTGEDYPGSGVAPVGGPYRIHAHAAPNPGKTSAQATEATPGIPTPGRVTGTDDEDWFKVVLADEADLWAAAVGGSVFASGYCWGGDHVGRLLDSDLNELDHSGRSLLVSDPCGFMFRRRLAAGTYFIEATSNSDYGLAPYTMEVRLAESAGETAAAATPLGLQKTGMGRIEQAGDSNYFSLTLDGETQVGMQVVAFGDTQPNANILQLAPTVRDKDGNVVSLSVEPATVTDPDSFEFSDRARMFLAYGALPAGRNTIRLAAPSNQSGSYAIQVWRDGAYTLFLNLCEAIDAAPSDPLYGCQWHLTNSGQFVGDSAGQDIGVDGVWGDHTGAGVTVAVVDTGLQSDHEDLVANVDETKNRAYGGVPFYNPASTHGTAVAGLIAAAANDIGMRGVAPEAEIHGRNILGATVVSNADEADAMVADLDDTAIVNNSWGTADHGHPHPAPSTWEMAVERGVTKGYGGKGISYFWAAGNGGDSAEDDSNLEGLANFYAVAAVCAVNYQDERSTYSERGANLWICGPSSDNAADLPGIATTTTRNRYRRTFGGTSAATPIVSGVAALLRGAGPDLTWRDVKLILAASARQNDPTHSSWKTGALMYGSDTERYTHNRSYGFGVVDAEAALDLAEDWANVSALQTVEATSGEIALTIPDRSGRPRPTSTRLTLGEGVSFIEFVEIETVFDHDSFRDLRVALVSPSGTTTTLSPAAHYAFELRGDPLREPFRFGAAGFLGEPAEGMWTLRIEDELSGHGGSLDSWRIKAYGHTRGPDSPEVTLVSPGDGALAVQWAAPDDTGGVAVATYDLRHIGSDAADKADSFWTVAESVWSEDGGVLRHLLSGLTNATGYDVQVRAVTTAGTGEWSATLSGTPSATGAAAIFATTETGVREVAENTAAGQDIGAPVAAVDGDGDTLTYSLDGPDADSFDIVSTTGRLRTRAALDHETRHSYQVDVSVHDGKDASGVADAAVDDTITVTIGVTDVDEPGVVSLRPAALRVGEIVQAVVNDPEGVVGQATWTWEASSDRVTWTQVGGADAGYTPTASDESMYLRAAASYTDADGPGKIAQGVTAATVGARAPAPNFTIVELVSGLTYPWDLGFTPDGYMLYTERGGDLEFRTPAGATFKLSSLFPDLQVAGEGGLMSIAVSPRFASDRLVYTCHNADGEIQVTVHKIDQPWRHALGGAAPLVDGIPSDSDGRHSGCRLRFGPDSYLWIATGDAATEGAPQDLGSLGGKILRIDPQTGLSVPTNPYSRARLVYTYGHRNPQGLAHRPGTNQMWAVEHGPDFDDEINLLVSGGNYGWNPGPGYDEEVPMTDLDAFPDAVEAKWSSGYPTLATSGAVFLDGDDWDDWEGRLAVAALKDEALHLFGFASDGEFVSHLVAPELDVYGRLRTPVLGPDGSLYLTTSNGNGNDVILKVAPSDPPSFAPVADTHHELAENNPAHRDLLTVAATDPDGDRLTYTVGGPDAAFFHFPNPSVGRLRSRAPLDFETQSFYDIDATATDPYGLSATITVTIEVTDVEPERPPPPPPPPPPPDPGGGGSGGGSGGGDTEPLKASELFEDIAVGVWYEQAVSWMILHRVTSGCETTLFCPEANLRRRQFVTFLWRAAGRPAAPYLGSEAFGDVTEGGYAEQSIGWAVANGVTEGCTPGEFGDPDWMFCPTQDVTRGQMATLLYRHVEAGYQGEEPPYSDVEPDRYYAPGISWLTDFEVVPGCGPGLFCPDRPATRAEAAVFINGVAIRPHIWGQGNTSFIPQPQ